MVYQDWHNARVQFGGGRLLGEVLTWKGNFGWIRPDIAVEHEEAWKHGGRIYVSRRDAEGTLQCGSRVSFLAYSDGDGIGAVQVRLESADGPDASAQGCDDGVTMPARKKGACAVASKGCNGVQRTIEKPVDKVGAKAGGNKCNGAAKGKIVSRKGVPPSILAALGLGPRREKHTESGSDAVVRWASSEMQGWRPAMEDATCVILELPAPLYAFSLFAVFDGHGGAEVSARAAQELPDVIISCAEELMAQLHGPCAQHELPEKALALALPALDARLRADGAAAGGDGGQLRPAGLVCDVNNAFALMGSTAVVALVERDVNLRPCRITVANCGDSRASLCREGVVVQLSEDQKPENEVERCRIEAAGGHVAKVGPCHRVDGWGLNLSRALGDFHYKAREDLPAEEQKVSCCPEIMSQEINGEDEFLLLGCDGVYELHDWQDAIDIVRGGLMVEKSLTTVVEDLVDASCSSDLMATSGHGGDNVSALLVMLQ